MRKGGKEMSSPSLASPPPTQTYALLSFPSPNILFVTFNRPQSLNCVNVASSWELDALFTWFDNEPSLRVAIVTGSGRAFCAGADLKGRFIGSLLESEVFAGIIGNARATGYALKRSQSYFFAEGYC